MAGKNSLCDVSSENCSTFSVFGQDFLSGPGLGCRVRPITVEETDPANWKYLEDRLEAVVEFVDVTTIRCSMSQSVLDTTQLSLQSVTLEVELTNTGTVWSSGIFLTIHNSTCTSCAHQSSPLLPKLCRQSDDVCRSDSKVSTFTFILFFREGTECYTAEAPHPHKSCQYCKNGDWHNRTDYRPIFTKVSGTIKFPILILKGIRIKPGWILIYFIFNFIVENCNGESVRRF